MVKTFSKIEIAILKRTAQNVAQFTNKKEKLNAEIEKIEATKQEMIQEALAKVDEKIALKKAKIEAEKAALQPIIDSFQTPIKDMTGGYTTEDLVKREVVHTGKMDANGKEILTTRFVLKYPDTVVPVEEESVAGEEVDEEPECPVDEDVPSEALEPTEEEVEATEAISADPFADAEGW